MVDSIARDRNGMLAVTRCVFVMMQRQGCTAVMTGNYIVLLDFFFNLKGDAWTY